MKDIVNHLRNISEITGLDWQHHITMARSAADAIEKLDADLEGAIEVAFDHGATEWVKLNHPDHYARLSKKSEG
ncbi:hypothetical protein [Hoeflea sp. TYP-13]|uniref:hypothetical protein n=1 Tax=Hoeflea sp. TYP-13 TaxID=3230023 RepID=UPI0034C60149